MSMSFQAIGTAAKGSDFQARCRGSMIAMAAAIIAAPLASNAIQNNAGADLTTQDCKNLANNYCRGTHLFNDQTLASLMLLNSAVAAEPLSADDGPVQYQTKEIWLTLVEIGG